MCVLGNKREKGRHRGRKGSAIEEVERAKIKTVRESVCASCVCVYRHPKVSQCAVWLDDDPLGM